MAYSSDLTLGAAPHMQRTSVLDVPATRISWRWWTAWIVLFGAFSMIVPRDASYDVIHYHLHNGWAALNGRDGFDLAPAEMHSFLNPAWQVFVWGLIDNLPGRAVAFVLGALQAVSLPALYALTRRVLVRAGTQPLQVTVMVIAVTGFMAESQLGLLSSVRNDAVFAGLFITALALILPDDRPLARWQSFALGSFIVGALMGTKLTAALYVLMFAVPALILMPDWKSRLRLVPICAAAGLAGLLVFGGYWGLYLWQTYGNPMFPALNAYFDAPLGPDSAFRDTRMIPDSLVAGLIKPIYMLFDATYSSGAYEHYFDPRLQMTYLCGLAIPAIVVMRRLTLPAGAARMALALSSGSVLAIVAWVMMFSFSRYLSAAWLIGPTMLALTVALAAPQLFKTKPAAFGVFALSAIIILTTTFLPVRRVAWTSWTEPYATATLPSNTDYSNAIIAFSGDYPGAFMAPYFPPEARLTHLAPQDWSAPALENYRPQIHSLIRTSERPLYTIIVDVEDYFQTTIDRLAAIERVGVRTDTCQTITSSLQTPDVSWKICEAYPID